MARFSEFREAAKRFQRGETGVVAVVGALIAFVLVGAAGAALDIGSHYRLVSQVQNATDAAALHVARRYPNKSRGFMESRAREYYAMNGGPANAILTLEKTEEGVRIFAEGTRPNFLLPVIGFDTFDVSVMSEVLTGTGLMEIALVLDNTGSMAPHMDELRDAAEDLVDILYDGNGDSALSIAVVPYAGTVNIGNGSTQMGWMDTAAISYHHGQRYRNRAFAQSIDPCTPSPDTGPGSTDTSPGPAGTGTDRGAFLNGGSIRKFARAVSSVFISPAHAYDNSDVPAPYTVWRECWLRNPPTVNLFTDVLSPMGMSWKGCVEARPMPYDVTDDAPSTIGNTRFVPWVWPDEPDASVWSSKNFMNDYIDDKANALPELDPANPLWEYEPGWAGGRLLAIHKYQSPTSIDYDDTPPGTKGPNQGCPDPIMPLTNKKGDIKSKIKNLHAWEGGGTNAALGLAWGWRALSPGAPFTQGADYGDARKVIVLMTDGINMVEPHSASDINSEWSAYGYLRDGRLGFYTHSAMTAHINARMLQVCANAKAEGVQIYTVTFGSTPSSVKALYEQCSTDATTHAFDATTVTQLNDAFQQIARTIQQTRLAK